MELLNLLYHLKFNQIFLWIENNSNISLSFGDNFEELIESLQEDLKYHKSNLLKILEYNKIFSEEDSKSIAYYKVPFELNQLELSHSQKSIYLHSKIEKTGYVYNVPLFIKFKNLDFEKLQQAIVFILKKHPILRIKLESNFRYEIQDIEIFRIKRIVVPSIQIINQFCINKARQQFRLDDEKLIRLELFIIESTDEAILDLTHHHILSDAYSVGIIVTDLLIKYKELISTSKSYILEQSESVINYFDYVNYQNYKLQTEGYIKAISTLAERLSVAEFITLKKENALFNNMANRINITLNKATYQKLKQLSIDNGVSLYSILLTGFYHTLSLYSGWKKNFAVGITVSNRPFEFNKAVGPFISILPLMPEYDLSSSFLNNIRNFHKELSYLNEYQEINLNLLIEKLKYHPESISKLIHIIFSLHNFKQEIVEDNEYQYIDIKELGEKVGISVIAEETMDNISFNVSYAANLYNEDYIKSILNSYVSFLTAVDDIDMSKQIKDIEYLGKEEYERIVYEWNKTDKEYDINRKITEVFEEWVTIQPDSIAVIYDEFRITYSELNKRANKLAHYLIDNYKLRGDELVALCLDRSENMLVAILGVLKAGGAYVPIDPSYPDERIRYILEDTESKVVIANGMYKQRLDNITKTPIIAIDDLTFWKQIFSYSSSTPKVSSTYRNLAYVIYTSGTTGNPKGVMIEHISVINYIYNVNELLRQDGSIVDFSTSISFDLSVTTTLWSLCSGSTIVVYVQQLQDLGQYKNHLAKHLINFLKLTPNYFELLIESLELTKINKVILGGEKVSDTLLNQLAEYSNNLQLIIYDEYGPTETTVGTSQNKIYPEFNTNIGKPYNNYTLYILDQYLNPLPVGAVGELYIGGWGLARGYFNQPCLTAEKFIANPFRLSPCKQYNLRLYKTGDIVRFLHDGNIEYIMRNDKQIKFNGFRIELSEIEYALKKHMDIKEAVVILKEEYLPLKKILTAYIIAGEFVPSKKELRDFLQKILPEYMIPSDFIYLNSLPLTINGKLDKTKLLGINNSEKKYITARDDFEKEIAYLWSEILSIQESEISVYDDFFKLGGNSLLAIKLINKLNQKFSFKVEIDIILKNSKFSKLCCLLKQYRHISKIGKKYEF